MRGFALLDGPTRVPKQVLSYKDYFVSIVARLSMLIMLLYSNEFQTLFNRLSRNEKLDLVVLMPLSAAYCLFVLQRTDIWTKKSTNRVTWGNMISDSIVMQILPILFYDLLS